jgi:hypothetical protein
MTLMWIGFNARRHNVAILRVYDVFSMLQSR